MDYQNCELCPRRCGAERTEERGEGFCAMPVLRVAPGGYEEVSGG